MPWQVTLKRKDGTIRADLGKGGSGAPPKVGDIVEYPIGDEVVKAKVVSVTPTSVGSSVGQPVDLVKLEEL